MVDGWCLMPQFLIFLSSFDYIALSNNVMTKTKAHFLTSLYNIFFPQIHSKVKFSSFIITGRDNRKKIKQSCHFLYSITSISSLPLIGPISISPLLHAGLWLVLPISIFSSSLHASLWLVLYIPIFSSSLLNAALWLVLSISISSSLLNHRLKAWYIPSSIPSSLAI